MCSERKYGIPPCPWCGAAGLMSIERGYHTSRAFKCCTRQLWTNGKTIRSATCEHDEQTDLGRGMEWAGIQIELDESMPEGAVEIRTKQQPLDCPECPGTTTEHYPDCGVGSDERYRERTGK